MSTFNGVTGSLASLPDVSATEQSTASSALGKDAFLKLLTTQMQHQDPLNPMDSQAFVAQLAQFSSLETLQGLGTKLDTMLVAQASANQMNTTSLVGKEILFHADKVGLTPGTPSKFDVTLDGSTDDTAVILADSNGQVVRTLQLGAHDAGTFSASWDGLDDQGRALPSGEYVMSVAGTKTDGSAVTAAASVRGTVTGVTFENQVPQLLVAGRHIQLSDVVEISSASSP